MERNVRRLSLNPLERGRGDLVTLPAVYGPLGLSVAFRIGRKVGGIEIGNMCDRFLRSCLTLRLEQPERSLYIPEQTIWFWDLKRRDMSDQQVFYKWMTELGLPAAEDWRVLELARLYQLMELGGHGPVHMDGAPNFAFIKTPFDRTVETVCFHVYMKTWHISLARPPGQVMCKGSRLFAGVPQGTQTPPVPPDDEDDIFKYSTS